LREKNNGSALCHRIKLMCVGQANVGKTSLVEKLLSKSVTKPTESESGQARAGRSGQTDDHELGTSGASMRAEVNNKAVSAVKRTDSERNRRWSYSEVEHGKLSLISSGGAVGGEEGDDKSSPAKNRRRPNKKVDVATDGIRIRDWTAKSITRKDSSGASKKESGKTESSGKSENIITFSSWDFAGQEIYYYTHLFFLSRRGIYLLIFNLLKPEEEASRIEYWLQSIHTRARGNLVALSSVMRTPLNGVSHHERDG
jgi:GTPase SAR1 family protein